MGKTEGLLELVKSLIEKYGEVLLKKSKRVWLACLLAISSGILIWNLQWIIGKNILEVSVILIFVVCMVALAMWMFEFIYVNLKKRKGLKKQIIQSQQIVKDTVESFSLDELEFLMQFDERSKRATVWYADENYDKFLSLNVVEPVSQVGEEGICIKLTGEYEEQWDKLKDRFSEEIIEKIESLSNDLIRYLINFKEVEEQEKSEKSDRIERVMDIFEGRRYRRLKGCYKRCILDAKNVWNKRTNEFLRKELERQSEREEQEEIESSEGYQEYLDDQEKDRALYDEINK